MQTRNILITLFMAFAATAHAGDQADYRITITNATVQQVITPPLIVIHRAGFNLFSVGSVASTGLATLAETGDNSVLNSEVNGIRDVISTIAASEVIPYGHSTSFDFSAPKKAHISLAGMLATTNDGFAGLNDVSLPDQSEHYYAYAYDAGSEMNNESCAYIPGPPCPATSGNLRTDSGEGFISIHNGIHGGSDLNPKQLDWRGPVAVITIERIKD
jgi:hypothetical protein